MKICQYRRLALGFVLLIAGACSLDDGPTTGTLLSVSRQSEGDGLPDKPSLGNEGDEYLFDIAREVPSYGGHRQTRNGDFIVSSTDSNDFVAVRYAILSRISNRRIYTHYKGTLPRVSVIRADYSIRQLAVWRDSIIASKSVLPWNMIDLDEGRNRVTIGVDPGTDFSETSEFGRQVARLGIPWSALNVIPLGRPNPTFRRVPYPTPTTIRHPTDSLAGGFQFVWNNFGSWNACTIGFTARISNGTKGFISASHCSQGKWQDDTTSLMQPDQGWTGIVGREEWDMAPGTCPFFWSCNHYRFSDANLNLVDTTARKVKVGFLARPSTRNHDSGTDTTISSGNPYIEVIGETSSIVQGSDIDQIGRTTGWTYSEVKHTCVTWDNRPWPWNGQALRCAYIVDADIGDGDSGGPVFYYSGGQATAAGITAAQISWPVHYGVFSKFMYVRNEIQSSGLTFSILPATTPASYYPYYASISGAATIQPSASCHYMSSSNISYTSITWSVNGTVVGTNWDVYYSSASSFLLEVEVSDGTNVAFGSKLVTVSNEAGTCYDQ
jgi:hypothetical protein